MDDWVYPVDMVPPSLESIVKSPINKKIVQALKKICKNKNIKALYLPGNHDMGVNIELIEKNFPGMIFGGTALYDSVYRSSRLRAEHGSAYAMFNAPDATNSPGARLPLGYFISRVVATKSRNTGSTDRHYWTYGAGVAFKAMMAEIGFLGNLADRLCKKNDTNVVIFGHSHDWKLDKDKWFVDDRIYANCGTWCDDSKPYTWVESQLSCIPP